MEERLRLHRFGSRILEIVEDDGTSHEYPVRVKLDVETMATFLEIEEVLTSNRHPDTGQPLSGNEKAHYYRLAHDRVLEVVREQTPNARLSLDVTELLATMALLCGNVSTAIEIAGGLADAAGVEIAGDGSDPTTAPGAGQEVPFDRSATFSPSASTGSESETGGGRTTGEGSPGMSSSDTSPTPAEPTETTPAA